MFHSLTVLDEAGEKLFTGDSEASLASWSWPRTVKHISGIPIFNLRKVFGYSVKNKWVVESPSGREVSTLRHVSWSQREALDMVVKNEAYKGNEVTVEVRPKDKSALTTLANIGGAIIAEIQPTEFNDVVDLNDRDRNVWKTRIAGGVDLALVSIDAAAYIQILISDIDRGSHALPRRDATCLEEMNDVISFLQAWKAFRK
jgi:hypothetical protein